MRALWHRLLCVTFERNVIRETVGGIPGYRCACGLWRPMVHRPEADRRNVLRPAHERYRAIVRLRIIRRRA